ncbi:hypothetical protein SAMN05446037_101384 [Anaerovirgula multivorans]|uniref:Uncharacterized protein n=1 Tax=Anaerovirgula multivorans TaxID=312168 RepID=A0A239FLV2_9FIRM|nr:hypothetical protein SAMN05446037_101384 [Anaerovirgula multivorans]
MNKSAERSNYIIYSIVINHSSGYFGKNKEE